MENKVEFSQLGSFPGLTSRQKWPFFSASTHPAIRERNTEDLFKRIRSGDEVLGRLPIRLDRNLQFSDDDDEEEEKMNKVDAPFKIEKTPEIKSAIARFHPPTKADINKLRNFSSARKSNSGQAIKLQINSNFLQTETKVKPPSNFPEFSSKLKQDSIPTPFKSSVSAVLGKSRLAGTSEKSRAIVQERLLSPVSEEKVSINGDQYAIISVLGSGGSCKVYSALDSKKQLVAIKCVDLKNADPTIRIGYKKEIEYLEKLQESNRVIKMHNYEYRKNELFLVLEQGEIDFAKYISNEAKQSRMTPIMIKFYWQQMLEAVRDIHKHGIVHSDLKPANFLLVKGNLKLIDFGIAAAVPEDMTSAIRETQVGTLNYMSPEAVTQHGADEQVQFKVGVKSDVWSLGCILYNLVYGSTPFQSIRHVFAKIKAIQDPKHEIQFPPIADKYLVEVLKACLQRNPKDRASVEELLLHPYIVSDNVKMENSSVPEPKDLKNFVDQIQDFTPRRIKYLRKIVQDLSESAA